jgi:hypothetical protein
MELITTSRPALYDGGNTKKEIESLALLLVEDVLEKGNPLELAERIAATENLIKALKENSRFTDYVKEELAKSSGKFSTPSGTRIEACEVSVSYDYSSNGDWLALDSQEKEIKERKKALEEKLRKIPSGKLLVDDQTGETLIGPVKTSKSSYKVTLQK